MKKSAAEQNPFNLEDLVVKPDTTVGAKASPKNGQGTARQRRGSFIQITAAQADGLSNASVVVAVFFHLMFRSFRAYHKPFVLPNDALKHAGISRFAQIRALRSLARRGLISVERDGPRKSPVITIIGTTRQG